MINPNINPLPFHPRTELEKTVCNLVTAECGEVVLNFWDQASYPYEDINGNPVPLEADYQVRTGKLYNGLFCTGSYFLVRVNNGAVEIEFESRWV
ncbi:hypothetical protein [Variovorax atrisoli]|uniref:hypothetical protein n=1 Tax=Variovorax atrisoli TaxID=3394203 RepID=UPI00160F0314|nr:hypothetical protein [Variovorax sp. BK613]MBB3641912.1 hypothetical protein [Variovorax sp. BK613]